MSNHIIKHGKHLSQDFNFWLKLGPHPSGQNIFFCNKLLQVYYTYTPQPECRGIIFIG